VPQYYCSKKQKNYLLFASFYLLSVLNKYDWDILLPSYTTLQYYPYWFQNNLSHFKNEGDFYYEGETV